jgi:hypothetical protein
MSLAAWLEETFLFLAQFFLLLLLLLFLDRCRCSSSKEFESMMFKD